MACTELTPMHMELLQAVEDSGGIQLTSQINLRMAHDMTGLSLIEFRDGLFRIMPDGASTLSDWRELGA